jgi:RNase H-fold protein (predicted Holliday junction resolvase)
MAAEPPLLAIDPGFHKCGMAVVATDGGVLARAVVAADAAVATAREWVARFGCRQILLGNRTTAQDFSRRLAASGIAAEVLLVDEHRSTEEARRRYFEDNPPRGWRRLVPQGLLSPPRAYDDYVAVILAEHYLSR